MAASWTPHPDQTPSTVSSNQYVPHHVQGWRHIDRALRGDTKRLLRLAIRPLSCPEAFSGDGRR
jgi:hypothetical protein